MEIIEKLQRSRPEIVHVFDEIVRTLPEGVYLTAIKQNGKHAEVRRRRAVEHARVLLHAQHRRLAVAEQSGARGRADEQGRRPGLKLHARPRSRLRPPGGGCRQRGRGAKAQASGKRSAPMNLLEELRSLDPRDPGRWPLPVRAGAVAGWPSWCSRRCRHLLLGLERTAPAAAAVRRRGAAAAQEFRDKHAKAVNLERLQAAAEGHRALLRRDAAPAAGQDRGAEPAGGHLADRPGRRRSRRSCSSRSPSSARTSTPSCRSRSASPAATTSSASSSAASRRCRASSRCTTSRSSRTARTPTTSCRWS